MGYVSAEAYQYLFGEEIIKVVGKAAKAARDSQQSLPTGAKLATNSVRLEKQLASEAQIASEGRIIIEAKDLKEAPRLVKQYGGNPQDWVKKTSDSFISKDGAYFEAHWYENLKTGQKVEFKTKY